MGKWTQKMACHTDQNTGQVNILYRALQFGASMILMLWVKIILN
jgi:hypothetical protein